MPWSSNDGTIAAQSQEITHQVAAPQSSSGSGNHNNGSHEKMMQLIGTSQ